MRKYIDKGKAEAARRRTKPDGQISLSEVAETGDEPF